MIKTFLRIFCSANTSPVIEHFHTHIRIDFHKLDNSPAHKRKQIVTIDDTENSRIAQRQIYFDRTIVVSVVSEKMRKRF